MLLSEPFVSLVAILSNPLFKWLTDFGVNDITNVLSGHLADLPQDWEAVLNDLIGKTKVQDEVKRQIFILRQCNVLDLVAIDSLQKMNIRYGHLRF